MARTARNFSRLLEGEEVIQKLSEKYQDLLWAVVPSQIVVMCVDNVERTDKAKAKEPVFCKLRLIKGAEKAVLEDSNIKVRYIIELFASDWHEWSTEVRQWALLNCLLQINSDPEKRNTPDCVGFRILLDKVGVKWNMDANSKLPNLLSEDVDFDMTLLPGIDLDSEQDDDA